MPKSKGRPLNRIAKALQSLRQRIVRRNPGSTNSSHIEQLKDRRDYRQSLIHRLATAHGVRRQVLETKLAEVEHQIAKLRGAA